ncbi:hypothetical protein FKM82_005993 [Ascaphus truei]
MHSWGYDDHNGPARWHELFSLANGDRQSPINIITQDVTCDPTLQPLHIHYDPASAKVILNSGHTFSVEFDDAEDKSVTLCPFQLHIVHWNSEKYSSFVEAAHQPDGLGVLGVFLKIGEHNTNIARITDALDAIKSKGKQSSFTDFDPSCLFPDCLDFWTYPGSLTVPPLFESVIWIVLKEPISVSSEQVGAIKT